MPRNVDRSRKAPLSLRFDPAYSPSARCLQESNPAHLGHATAIRTRKPYTTSEPIHLSVCRRNKTSTTARARDNTTCILIRRGCRSAACCRQYLQQRPNALNCRTVIVVSVSVRLEYSFDRRLVHRLGSVQHCTPAPGRRRVGLGGCCSLCILSGLAASVSDPNIIVLRIRPTATSSRRRRPNLTPTKAPPLFRPTAAMRYRVRYVALAASEPQP